jgi:hypothetical protein
MAFPAFRFISPLRCEDAASIGAIELSVRFEEAGVKLSPPSGVRAASICSMEAWEYQYNLIVAYSCLKKRIFINLHL